MLPIIFESLYFTLYAYPLFMGLAWGFGYFFTKELFQKQHVTPEGLNSLFLGVFISAWVGAKLFFLYFSSGPKIYQYIYANYFWLGGGFVFYGGLILGLIFYFLWSLYLKKFDHRNTKFLIPGLVFGHAIGRVGCFLAGCCYGATTNSFLAIKIANESRYPVQLFEACALFVLGLYLMKLISKKASNLKMISSYLISYSFIRFFLEFLRGDEIRGIYFLNFSTSQLISLILILITVLNLIYRNKKAL